MREENEDGVLKDRSVRRGDDRGLEGFNNKL